jgi:hypothetical protein
MDDGRRVLDRAALMAGLGAKHARREPTKSLPAFAIRKQLIGCRKEMDAREKG